MSKKLVVVLGATGTQGGSVVASLLGHGAYSIRGLTRNTSGPAAEALSAKGVEMVSADLADKDSLAKAFKGAYAVFGVTMPFTKDSEEVQGKNIVDACKANDVRLLVWSSLPNGGEVSGGKYTKIKHWDEKAEVDKYISAVGQPAVILQTGGFTSNLVLFHQFQPDPADASKFQLCFPIIRPTVTIAYTDVEADLGNVVKTVIDNWEDAASREKLTKAPIPVCSYHITAQGMVDVIKRVSGKEVEYVQLPDTAIPMEEGKQMLQLADDGLIFPNVPFPTEIFVEMGVKFHTFEDFVREKLLPIVNAQK